MSVEETFVASLGPRPPAKNENAWFGRIASEDDPRLEMFEAEERRLWEPDPYEDDRFWNEVPW